MQKVNKFNFIILDFHNQNLFRLLQIISIKHRCNRVIDCEDGTDEQYCSCKEYLASSYPDAICDGTMDCEDGSDEKNCCKQFY